MDFQIFSIDDEEEAMSVTLTEEEAKMLADKSKREKEAFIMRKFVEEFQWFNDGSQGECFKQLNKFREANGYKPWKSQRSVAQIWEEISPFRNEEFFKEAKPMIAIFPDDTKIETPSITKMTEYLSKNYCKIGDHTIAELAYTEKPFEPRLYQHRKLKGLILKYVETE